MRFLVRLILVSWALFPAGSAGAGTWSQLPDAVAQLQVDPRNPSASEIVRQTGASIQSEAEAGRLSAVATLMEVYSSLVTRLPDGERRMRAVEEQVAASLVVYGLEIRKRNFDTAATAWTMAATYDPAAQERTPELLHGADPRDSPAASGSRDWRFVAGAARWSGTRVSPAGPHQGGVF